MLEEITTEEKSKQSKKDLRKVLILAAILIVVLFGLFIFDQQTGQLSQLAQKLINLAVGK
jgi:signal transduction histidine kinase